MVATTVTAQRLLIIGSGPIFFVFYNDIGRFRCQFKPGFGVQQSCRQSDQVNDHNNRVL